MSIDTTWRSASNDSQTTEQIGQQIGMKLRGGEVIELIGDLGAGKTVFVRGLAAGMGSKDAVASPSFTISREYQADKLRMYHFDFYRLQDAGIIKNELAEVIGESDTVVVIEWSDIVHDILPAHRLEVAIERTPEDNRLVSIKYDDSTAYLVDNPNQETT